MSDRWRLAFAALLALVVLRFALGVTPGADITPAKAAERLSAEEDPVAAAWWLSRVDADARDAEHAALLRRALEDDREAVWSAAMRRVDAAFANDPEVRAALLELAAETNSRDQRNWLQGMVFERLAGDVPEFATIEYDWQPSKGLPRLNP